METGDNRRSAVVDPDADERITNLEDPGAVEDWVVIERLQARNADADPDAVIADVTAAVAEVRQEMYAERQARPRR